MTGLYWLPMNNKQIMIRVDLVGHIQNEADETNLWFGTVFGLVRIGCAHRKNLIIFEIKNIGTNLEFDLN